MYWSLPKLLLHVLSSPTLYLHVLVQSHSVRLLDTRSDGAEEILRSHVDVVPNLPETGSLFCLHCSLLHKSLAKKKKYCYA